MSTDNISPSVSYHAVNVNDEVTDSNGWIKYEFSPLTPYNFFIIQDKKLLSKIL